MFEGRTTGGLTPLMYAIRSGSENMVRECLHQGMDPHVKDYAGRDCLSYAGDVQNRDIERDTRLGVQSDIITQLIKDALQNVVIASADLDF